MNDIVQSLEAAIFPALKALWSQVFGHVTVVHTDKWLAVYVQVTDPSFQGSEFSAVVRKTDELVNTTEFKGQICRFLGGGSVLRAIGEDGHFYCYQFWLPIAPGRNREDFNKFFPRTSGPP